MATRRKRLLFLAGSVSFTLSISLLSASEHDLRTRRPRLIVSATAATAAIAVRFSNQSSATDGELADLEATTRQLFARGGIDVSWSRCLDRTRHVTPDSGCEKPAGPAVVFLYVVDVAPQLNLHLLGRSTLGTGRATVFYLRARTMVSVVKDVSVGQVLGHAAAHEIVHLFLGPDHSTSGVMKGDVSLDDLHDMAQGCSRFRRAELDQVRSALIAAQTRIAEGR
jgi:hypothetical protein